MNIPGNENKIRYEQVKLLYDSVPISLATTLLIAFVQSFILWRSSLDKALIITWYIAVIIISLSRFIIYLYYKKTSQQVKKRLDLYENLFNAGVFFAGLSWGSLSLFLYPDELTFDVTIAFVIAGISAGAISALAFRIISIRIFLVLAIAPLVARFLSSPSHVLESMGLMVLLFLVMLYVIANRIYNNTEQNIRYRIDADNHKQELENYNNALQAFHSITTNSIHSLNYKLNQLLKLGLKTFNLDIGIISNIKHDVYVIEYIVGPEGIPEVGTVFDFHETYCANTFLGNTPKGFNHVAESEIASHPCYEKFKLEAYLGAPLFVGYKRYGTLNFSSALPRPRPFSEHEIALIQLMAQWAGNEIARTNSEQQLLRFKTTLDMTHDCVFMFEPQNLRFFYVNQGAVDQVGYTESELLTMSPVDLIPEITSKQFNDIVSPLLRKENDSISFETIHQHKNGLHIPVEIFLQYIAPRDEPPRFVAIVRDITERKRIDKMKNDFISTVSHELRTPLTSIRGSLGLITGGAMGDIPEKVNHLVEVADNNAERLIRLINDILDIQKIESGKMSFRFDHLILTDFLQKVLNANDGYAQQHAVTFNLVCDSDGVEIWADEERLMQVMANLLSNAIKFSPPNATIDIDCHEEQDMLCLSVTDHGPGIPEKFQAQMFDKFTQADSSDTRRVGGTGLGLSIAKMIVEQHKGTIRYQSEEGIGTTFYITLPLFRG